MLSKAYRAAVLAVMFVVVLAPALYVVGYTLANCREILADTFSHEVVGKGYLDLMLRALSLSLRLGLAVVLVDLVLGVPLAYVVARGKLKPSWLVEDVITLPLVVPTSAFGFAILLTWSSPGGLLQLLGLGRISQQHLVPLFNVPLLLLLTHVALTLPYVIRPLAAVLRSMGSTYEVISRSLKASPLTTFRRITVPLSIPAIISSLVLAVTRSLGETGATMIVAGVSMTASVAIVRLFYDMKLGLASLLATMLIAAALVLVLPAEFLSKKLLVTRRYRERRLETRLSRIERRISAVKHLALARDVALYIMLLLVIVAPLLFIFKNLPEYWYADPYSGKVEGGILYQVFGPAGYFSSVIRATLNSIVVAGLSTLAALYISILVFTAVRNSRLEYPVRALIRVPLVVPTSALGLSALLLFGEKGLGLAAPSIWLTTIVHTSFSVPIIFETLMSTYETLNIEDFEETARTLGATAYDALETVTLPLLKRGIVAGSLLAFTHSLGETGATIIVMGKDVTVPVLVVHMAEALAVPAALFTSAYLLLIAIVLLAVTRKISR